MIYRLAALVPIKLAWRRWIFHPAPRPLLVEVSAEMQNLAVLRRGNTRRYRSAVLSMWRALVLGSLHLSQSVQTSAYIDKARKRKWTEVQGRIALQNGASCTVSGDLWVVLKGQCMNLSPRPPTDKFMALLSSNCPYSGLRSRGMQMRRGFSQRNLWERGAAMDSENKQLQAVPIVWAKCLLRAE